MPRLQNAHVCHHDTSARLTCRRCPWVSCPSSTLSTDRRWPTWQKCWASPTPTARCTPLACTTTLARRLSSNRKGESGNGDPVPALHAARAAREPRLATLDHSATVDLCDVGGRQLAEPLGPGSGPRSQRVGHAGDRHTRLHRDAVDDQLQVERGPGQHRRDRCDGAQLARQDAVVDRERCDAIGKDAVTKHRAEMCRACAASCRSIAAS
jgi:hypothetical protein